MGEARPGSNNKKYSKNTALEPWRETWSGTHCPRQRQPRWPVPHCLNTVKGATCVNAGVLLIRKGGGRGTQPKIKNLQLRTHTDTLISHESNQKKSRTGKVGALAPETGRGKAKVKALLGVKDLGRVRLDRPVEQQLQGGNTQCGQGEHEPAASDSQSRTRPHHPSRSSTSICLKPARCRCPCSSPASAPVRGNTSPTRTAGMAGGG